MDSFIHLRYAKAFRILFANIEILSEDFNTLKAEIQKLKDGSLKPSYNCQVAVDEKEQIIVAADLVDEENDLHQIEPMIENVKETLRYKPTIVLEDAGYFSYDNMQFLLDEEIDAIFLTTFMK